jgi:HNH endonuclease
MHFRCDACGKAVWRDPWRRRGVHIFCDVRCAGRFRTTPLAERFWGFVDTTGACWVWTGATYHGRGQFCTESCGNGDLHYKNASAHRVAWTLTYGTIPRGMIVGQHCPGGANPLCVRPDHLVLRPQSEVQRGHPPYNAKLTPDQVRYAYRMRGKKPQRVLAEELGVCVATIRAIQGRRLWAALTCGLIADTTRCSSGKLTPDQVRYVYRMRGEKSYQQLADELGVCRDTIRRIQQRKGWAALTRDLVTDETRPLPRVGRKLTPAQVRYVYAMRGHARCQQLADELGVDHSMIWRIQHRKVWAALTSDLVSNERQSA